MLRRFFALAGVLTLATALLGPASLAAQPTVVDNVGDGVEREVQADGARVLVALHSTMPVDAPLSDVVPAVSGLQRSVLDALPADGITVHHEYATVPALSLTLRSLDALDALAANPAVRRVDLDVGAEAALAQLVPLIGADQMHSMGFTGEGVVAAVMDTGIDTDHPDLGDDLLGELCFGANFGSGFCHNGTTRDSGPGSAEDDQGHGTHVSGIISSAGIVSPIGVAPDAGIWSYKVLDSGGFMYFFSELVAALDDVNANPQRNITLINMSLASGQLFSGDCDNSTSWTMAAAAAIDSLRANGVTSFAAAGNSSANAMGAPACLSNVISVAASTNSDTPASFTNATSTTDIIAPGVGVTSDYLNGGTAVLSGTSMASPASAGCAALLIEAGAVSTPDQIETRLETSSVSITTFGTPLPRIECAETVGTDTVHFSNVNIALKIGQDRARGKATVEDNNGNRVQGAIVTGEWTVNGVPQGPQTDDTNSKGRAAIDLSSPPAGAALEFCVSDLSAPGLTYDPDANTTPLCAQETWPGGGGGGDTVHFSAVSISERPGRSQAFGNSTVVDETGALVSGAIVTGEWTVNGTPQGPQTDDTNAKGKAKIKLNNVPPGANLMFCVTDISATGMTYEPADNEVPTCVTSVFPSSSLTAL